MAIKKIRLPDNTEQTLDAELLSGYAAQKYFPTVAYNFTTGCFCKTSLTGTATVVYIEIFGRKHGTTTGGFYFVQARAYWYNGAFQSGYNQAIRYGESIGDITFFQYDGKLCFWFKVATGSCSFYVSCRAGSAGRNYVTEITNETIPSTATGNIVVTPSVAFSGTYLPLSGGTMSNTNVVTNLNADLLDGYNSTAYLPVIANNYSNGYLFTTNLTKTENRRIFIEILGRHPLATSGPYVMYAQAHWTANGTAFSLARAVTLTDTYRTLTLFVNADGYICLWFSQSATYSTFYVRILSTGTPQNRIVSVTNAALPSTATATLTLTPETIKDARITGVDSTPTSGSGNVITSGGVYTALNAIPSILSGSSAPTASQGNDGDIYIKLSSVN